MELSKFSDWVKAAVSTRYGISATPMTRQGLTRFARTSRLLTLTFEFDPMLGFFYIGLGVWVQGVNLRSHLGLCGNLIMSA